MNIQIRIGQPSSSLNDLLLVNGYQSWAIVTAWNPIEKSEVLKESSEPRRLRENIPDNAQLFSDLRHQGYIVLPAWGVPDRPNWYPEASFLVLGIDKETAAVLSRKFRQYAFVYGVSSTTVSKRCAQLVMLEGKPKSVYKETTYMVASLYLDQSSSLEAWLSGTGARTLRFSMTPFVDSIFQMPYCGGYLGWFL
jgi:hypothetical protein